MLEKLILEIGKVEGKYGDKLNEPWQKQYVFFGDSDSGWYCFDLCNKIYVELDKPSGALMTTYSDFNSMLVDALKSRLS